MNETPISVITIAARGRSSEAMKLRSTTNQSAGPKPHMAARTYDLAPAINSGSWRSRCRIGAMCQSTSEAGTLSASPIHSPWRTVRLGSRTAWRRRPRSCAIIGAVAATTPIENSSTTNMTLTPSTLAASASGPSQPIITTSVVWIATWPTLVNTIGTASAVSARASRRHAPAPWPLQVPIIVAMMPSYYCKTASAGTRHGNGAGIRHPCRRSSGFD